MREVLKSPGQVEARQWNRGSWLALPSQREHVCGHRNSHHMTLSFLHPSSLYISFTSAKKGSPSAQLRED